MNVVANDRLLRHFKKIKIFKLDLGWNLKGPTSSKKGPSKIKIKDEFIKKYENITGNIIHKYGDIGSILFYEDTTIKNEFYIFESDKIYEIEYSDDDLLLDPTEYLANTLRDIEEQNTNSKIEITKNVTYTNMPVDIETPDISLPKEQYIDAMVKRRAMLDGRV